MIELYKIFAVKYNNTTEWITENVLKSNMIQTVRPSHAGIVKRLYISKVFLPSGSPAVLVFKRLTLR